MRKMVLLRLTLPAAALPALEPVVPAPITAAPVGIVDAGQVLGRSEGKSRGSRRRAGSSGTSIRSIPALSWSGG